MAILGIAGKNGLSVVNQNGIVYTTPVIKKFGFKRRYTITPDTSVADSGLATGATSGTLVIGKTYKITTFATGDNFTNVATIVSGTTNTTGCIFTAKGTTPTTWSNGSTVTEYYGSVSRITVINAKGEKNKIYVTQDQTAIVNQATI